MKKLLLLLTLFCLQNALEAQDIEIITNVELPQGLLIVENDIYIGSASNPSGILKAPLNTSFPATSASFLPYPSECNDMAIRGNDLFIGQLDGGYIRKIDLILGPTSDEIIAGSFGSTVGLVIKEQYLYFSTGSSGRIRRIDILDLSAPSEIIIEGLNYVSGIEFIGDDLYFCDGISSGGVYKIDTSLANPSPVLIADGFSRPWGIAINGTNLFVSDLLNDEIKKINLANNNTVTTVLNVDNPRDIDIVGSYLYIAKSNEVIRVELNALSIGESQINSKINIYPNPTMDNLKIDNLTTNVPYKIFNIAGKLIKEGHTADTVNVQSFLNGLYFIELDNRIVFKFIKK